MAESGSPLKLSILQMVPGAPKLSEERTVSFLRKFMGLNWVAYSSSATVVICSVPYLTETTDQSILEVSQTIVSRSEEDDDVSHGLDEAQVSGVGWVEEGRYKGQLAFLQGNDVHVFQPTNREREEKGKGKE